MRSSAGVVGLAVLLCCGLTAAARPMTGRSLLTVSAPIIGYYQSFPLQIRPAKTGSQCLIGGVPTPDGLTAPATGQVILATTKGSGVHSVPFNITVPGYKLIDAVIGPSEYLKVDTTKNITLNYDSNNGTVGDVGSVTVALLNATDDSFICTSTITFTVVDGTACTATAPSTPIAPYPSNVPSTSNPTVSTTIINQITTIININYNINLQTNTVNYNSVTCICCYNSCNNYITVVQPGNPPAPPTVPSSLPPPPSPEAVPPTPADAPPSPDALVPTPSDEDDGVVALAPPPAPLEDDEEVLVPVPAPEFAPPPPPITSS